MERGRALTLRPAAEVGAGDAGHLRRLNLQRMLAVVMSQPTPFTRAELIEATGLSAPTVGSLVAHLVRSGVVRELGTAVVVENDVNLAVLGEHWRGAARGHDTCAFIFVGTGIGAGILIDGALHRGHHFMAGEIAMMCMGPQYLDGNFGSRGCLETLAGLKALSGRWPGADGRDPAEWLAELFEAAQAGDG